MTIGRPLESVSFDGREFACLGDGAADMTNGGFTGERQSHGSAKSSTNVLTPITGSMPDQPIAIDIDGDDLQFLLALKNSGRTDIQVVWTYAPGVSYSAACSISGELTYQAMTASANVSWAWDGVANKL